jgi:hypothetical protein
MRMARRKIRALLLFAFGIAAGLGVPLEASSRPEKIRPGEIYHSAELAEPTNQGLVRAPGPEKNYEEVYQFYTYYEFVVNEAERVILFREYKRGEVIRTEKYDYDASGHLTKRVVAQPGKESEVSLPETVSLNWRTN